MPQSGDVRSDWPLLQELHWPGDNVLVLAVSLREVALPDEELVSILSHPERQRAKQFQFELPRRQFVITRAALRTLLGRLNDVPAATVQLVIDTSGKPHLGSTHGSNVRFNVAHSGDLALIAIAAGCDVGIDIEVVRVVAHLERIARRYFHKAECEAIESLPPKERARAFLRCWTGKEAVVKSIGMGVAESLSSLCVPIGDHHGTWVDISRPSEAAGRVWLQPLSLNERYLAAVACVGEERRARCFTFGW